MRRLADDDEQVAFWRRHTLSGVGLCVLLPLIVVVDVWATPAAPHRVASLVLAAAVALPAPLLLLVPVERLVRHPRGRVFFDAWEAAGVLLVTTFALLDGGADSPYTLFFYVLLAHAALAYPPGGMVIAGAGNLAGYLVTALAGGGVAGAHLVTASMSLVVATAVCAFASYNHVRAYRRTAAYARQIAALAERDGLTGCLNHRTFHERLLAEAAITDRDHPLGLLIIDVDDFKSVNDTHGHPAGDAVLQLVAQVLISQCRVEDAAGRLGGDEFALLLPGTTPGDVAAVAERVCEQVRTRAWERGVTVSVGTAVSTARADGEGLLAAADRAVYRAKRAGRDRVAGADAAPAARGTARPGDRPAPAVSSPAAS